MDCCNSILPKGHPPKNHVPNGKIMLCLVIVLFIVSILLFFFHNFSSCFSLRRRRRQRQIRRQRMTRHLVFSSDNNITVTDERLENQGLELCVLKSLPVFIYDSKMGDPPPECAVCLSEFEDGERGRLLPTCGHRFHNDCIDMWFQSHSNCPLCRSPVLLHIPKPAKSDIESGGSGYEPDMEGRVNETGRSISSSQSAHCLRELDDI